MLTTLLSPRESRSQFGLVGPDRHPGDFAGAPGISMLMGGPGSAMRGPLAGVKVDEQSAMRLGVVYACINVIAGAVMSVPFTVRRRLPQGGSVDAYDHPASVLLHERFNPEMDAAVGRETLTAHMASWGNGYAEIERARDGRPIALWPILPDRCRPVRDADGRLLYEVQTAGYVGGAVGASRGATVYLDKADVWHPRALGYDGLVGYSPVRVAMEAVSQGLAAQAFGAAFFGNGAAPGVLISYPNKLSPEVREQARRRFKRKYSLRSRRAHEPLVLDHGASATRMTIPPNEAQFIQTHEWSVEDICRFFGVPPFMVGHMKSASYNNVEHQQIAFFHYMTRWAARLEGESNLKLVGEQDRANPTGGHFAKLNLNGLLRGDSTARANFYKTLQALGVLSPNDIRRLEDMTPVEGGDQYFIASNNLSPLDMVRAKAEAEIEGKRKGAAPAAESDGPARADEGEDGGDEDSDADDGGRGRRRDARAPEADRSALADRGARSVLEAALDAAQRMLRVESSIVAKAIKKGHGPEQVAAALRERLGPTRDAYLPVAKAAAAAAAAVLGAAPPEDLADLAADVAAEQNAESAQTFESHERWGAPGCERAARVARDLCERCAALALVRATDPDPKEPAHAQ